MGIGVTGNFFPLGFFPIIEDTYVLGGYRAFLSIVDRDNIPPLDRKVGMLCRTDNTGQVWRLSGGIANADWVLDGGSTPAIIVSNLYVSGLNGSDANDGLTPGTAVATLAKVFSLVPSSLAAPLVIHLGAAGAPGVAYTWSPMPTPVQLTADARIWLYGDGAGQVGEDGFVVVAGSPVAAIAGTDENQITTAVIVANAYQGFTLEVVDGPAAGYRRTIQSNTTTSILPVRRFETQDSNTAVIPVAGNTIRIIRPSVIFSGYDALTNQPGFLNGVGSGDGDAPLFLINLAFAAPTAQTEINNCTIFGCGVEFRGTTIAPYFVGCRGSFGNWDNIFEASAFQKTLPLSSNLSTAKAGWFADIGLPTALSQLALWRGWGVSQPDIVGTTNTTLGIQLLECQMSMFGTFGNLRSNSSTLAVGGWFWGNFQVDRGFCHILGRAPTASALLNNTVFSRKVYTELATVLSNTGSLGFTYTAASDETWDCINCDVSLLAGAVFTSILASFLKMSGGGTFDAQGAWSLIGVSSYASGLGMVSVLGGTFYDNASSFVITNGSDGPAFLASESGVIAGTGPATLTGPGTATSRCISALDGGSVKNTGAWTCAGGRLEVSNGAYEAAGALTVSGVTGVPLDLTQNARFLQSAGAMSLTSLTTFAIAATDSEAVFLGSALTLAANVVGTAALQLKHSNVHLKPTVITVTLGGIGMDSASELLCSVDLSIGGSLNLEDGSSFVCIGDFVCNASAGIVDSEATFIVSAALGVTGSCTLTRGKLSCAEALTLFSVTAIGSEINNTNDGAAGATTLIGTHIFQQSTFQSGNPVTLSGTLTGTASEFDFEDDVTLSGVVALSRCEVNCKANFTATTDFSLNESELDIVGNATWAGVTGPLFRNSEITTRGFIKVNERTRMVGGTWYARGALTAGSFLRSTAVGTEALLLEAGAIWDDLGVSSGIITFTGVVTADIVRVSEGSTFRYRNVNSAFTAGAAFGINYAGGGRVYIAGLPTTMGAMIFFGFSPGGAGGAADAYNQGLIVAGIVAVLDGQTPLGLYTIAANVTGSGFVQIV